jgi:hypothetical protein
MSFPTRPFFLLQNPSQSTVRDEPIPYYGKSSPCVPVTPPVDDFSYFFFLFITGFLEKMFPSSWEKMFVKWDIVVFYKN